MTLHVASPLPEVTEEVITRVIGCALTVHRELGPGFLESIYSTALCLEMAAEGLSYERERSVTVNYRGTPIGGQRIDLIGANAVLVELKAVTRVDPVFQAKVISYLRTTGLRAGLLMNFNSPLLKDGLKRIVV